MTEILKSPKEFFNSLSAQEFEELLNEFGFEYEDISDDTKEVQEIKRYSQSIKISSILSEGLFKNYQETECLREELELKLEDYTDSILGELVENNNKYKEEISIDFDKSNNNPLAA